MTKAQLMEAKLTPDQLNAVADYIQTNLASAYAGVDATGIVNNEGFIRGWFGAGALLRSASEGKGPENLNRPAPYTESQHPEKKTTPAQ